jgi:hypothetical protein
MNESSKPSSLPVQEDEPIANDPTAIAKPVRRRRTVAAPVEAEAQSTAEVLVAALPPAGEGVADGGTRAGDLASASTPPKPRRRRPAAAIVEPAPAAEASVGLDVDQQARAVEMPPAPLLQVAAPALDSSGPEANADLPTVPPLPSDGVSADAGAVAAGPDVAVGADARSEGEGVAFENAERAPPWSSRSPSRRAADRGPAIRRRR